MRIAFILPGSGRSGGIRNSVVAANQLLARGHHIRIFYRKQPNTLRLMFRSLRNRILYPGRYSWLEVFRGTKIGFHDIGECEFTPDETIVAVGFECSTILSALKSIGNPKVQYLRGMTFWIPEEVERALSFDIPKIVLSSHDRDYIESYSSGSLVEVIPNAVHQYEYYPDNTEKERTGVGTIYSSHPAKDPDTILAILDKLREDLPHIPQYVFSAGCKPKGIPRKNYVRFPSVPKARGIYSRCAVWVLASLSEGFGMPILEAMACGCAVVATDCGGPRDIITDGENGFLVKVGDVDGIVRRVEQLLNDQILRERFVRKSQETVNSFSWENSIGKLEEVLLKISEKK